MLSCDPSCGFSGGQKCGPENAPCSTRLDKDGCFVRTPRVARLGCVQRGSQSCTAQTLCRIAVELRHKPTSCMRGSLTDSLPPHSQSVLKDSFVIYLGRNKYAVIH